jgi:hypothetical protein|tara:strand:+ start:1816 stop:2415 length:600 start_codon:yes stop_codon:yes gene_type:complete
MTEVKKPKFPKGASSWWNSSRKDMTPEQLELRRKYDREFRVYSRQDPIKKQRDLDTYNRHVENNKEAVYERNAQWRRDNWAAVYKKRASKDTFKIENALRRRLHHTVTMKGHTKSKKTLDLLGCSSKFLKTHLENQFTEGMSWDNYGEWHIDHIIPCSSFDLSIPEHQQKCFDYMNLQPLWAIDNLKKGDTMNSQAAHI